MAVTLPPLPEQAAIVRYLDYVDRRIRRYIRAKQKLIALLNEQKQAIIHQAVTRGLDPNVRLKPSGVEWLGDVPEHWEVRRLKFLAQVDQRPVDVDTGSMRMNLDGAVSRLLSARRQSKRSRYSLDSETVLTAGDRWLVMLRCFTSINGSSTTTERV